MQQCRCCRQGRGRRERRRTCAGTGHREIESPLRTPCIVLDGFCHILLAVSSAMRGSKVKGGGGVY